MIGRMKGRGVHLWLKHPTVTLKSPLENRIEESRRVS
jgi:hypothetical protein